jgi:hypothetical protein
VETVIAEHLVADEDGRSTERPRIPMADVRAHCLIVAGDGNGVEPLMIGFEHEPPGRQGAVAPDRAVRVKVSGQHSVPAKYQRRTIGRPVRDGAGDDGHDKQANSN